ncbi:GGDEF domain-containing protein [Maricaulis sp.]|uniref:GGDEF domain-containing protein n=1 Tax=Maricaulis sp. TaxID=1486257 RepID=UPI003A95DE1A
MLDTKTLATALILLLVIGCALHVVNWRIHRDSAGVKWWAIGLATHTAGLTLSFWENSLAIHDPLWVVGICIVSLSGSLMLVHGTASFAGRPFPLSLYAGLVGVTVLGMSWFSTVDDSVTGRIIVYAVSLLSCYLLTISRLHFIIRRDGLVGVLTLAVALGGTTLLLSTLIVWQLLTQPDLRSLYDNNPVIPLGMLGLMASECAAMYGYLLLSAGHSQSQLEHLAHCDALTDLPNRRAFEQEIQKRLDSARKHDRRFALAIFDIDNFKDVNDAHGHDAGDAVLRHLGAVAAGAVRPHDFIARVGGEEFAVIFEVDDTTQLLIAANRLGIAIENERARFGETELAVTVSIGAVLSQSAATLAFGALYRAADEALYRAKAAGRNRVEIGEVKLMDLAA